jgi:hypothetical protein
MTNLAASKNPIIDEIDSLRATTTIVRGIRLDEESMLVSILVDGRPEKLLSVQATEGLPLSCMCNEAAAYLEAKNHPRAERPMFIPAIDSAHGSAAVFAITAPNSAPAAE